MLAVRSNERAAAGAAIDVRNVKLIAFGISALIAGVAGTLYAYNFGSVSPDRFSVPLALSLIAFAYPGHSLPALSPGCPLRRGSRPAFDSGSACPDSSSLRGVVLIFIIQIEGVADRSTARLGRAQRKAAAARP
jgi:hypothetical protein